MSKYRDLDAGDVFPAYWTDAIQEFTGVILSNVRLSLPSANVIRVAANTGSEQVSIGIAGLYRYRSTNAEVTVTGATGTYNLYAVASANDITGTTDTTDYNWYLAYGTTAPTGNTPNALPIVSTRKIGEFDWDNVAGAVTGLRQTLGVEDGTAPITPTATAAAVTPLTVRGAASQSGNLISAGSSASASDRLTLSPAGKLTLPVSGASGGLQVSDVSVYRSAATTLRVGGSLVVDSSLTADSIVVTTGISAGSIAEDGRVPIGGVMLYAGETAPTGWLLCDGSAVSRSTYSQLFAALGTYYGEGNGTTTFGIPDAYGCIIRATNV